MGWQNINLWLSIDCVVTNIHIEVPDEEQYDRLKDVKNKYGLTWRGMLVHAADDLDTPD
jgi:hypothetical protein